MNARSIALILALASPAAAVAQTPDPMVGLVRAVSGVVVEGSSPALVLTEAGKPPRLLKVGEDYRDGWRLTAVTAAAATLKKGSEIRTAGISARVMTAQEAADAGAGTQVALSNAVAGNRLKRPDRPGDPAKIKAAVAGGDVQQAYALGGSAADVAQALAAAGGPMAQMLANGGSANFVNVNGRTGVMVNSDQGDGRNRSAVVIPPELANAEPPADAAVLNPPMPGPGSTVTRDGQGNVMVRQVIGGGAPQ